MKKLMSVVFAAALAGAAWAENSADVLVWYIDTKSDGASYDGATRSFDTIKFWAVDSNNNKTGLGGLTYEGPEYLLAGTPAAGSGDTIAAMNAPTTFDGVFYTDLSNYKSGYTFLAEVYRSGQTDPVDRMLTPLTWSDFTGYMIASSDLLKDLNLTPSMGAYNMASTMVPEPTSGLLLLIGGALLALRRRRVA